MKFPDFIIIGAMKCATTVLWHNLNKHPEIFMGKNFEDPKLASTEIRFWNNGQPYRTWETKGLDWYKGIFKEGYCCGEKSANYVEELATMRRIREHIPNVKLVLCLREPVSRIYSEYNMQKDKINKPFSVELAYNRGYIYRSTYMDQINKHILSLFPAINLHIIIQERMKKDTAAEMNRLYEFLGVSHCDLDVVETTAEIAKNKKLDLKKDGKVKEYKIWASNYESMDAGIEKYLKDLFWAHNQTLFNFLGYGIEEWT